MNKKNIVFAAVLAASMLAGCKDAQAKLPDSSTVLMTVGNKSVTKGDVYSMMNRMNGSTAAVNNASRIIARTEIEVTDDMKKNAQETLDSYKMYYGDTFARHLELIGMSEDEYRDDYLIPSLQAAELTSKYIEENFDKVAVLYSPVKATLLSFTSQDDANAALSELKDGSKDAATAAKDHNSTSTGKSQIYTVESSSVDSAVRTVLNSGSPDDGWTVVPASDGATYVLMHIDENDPAKFRDEVIDTLESITQVQNDATTYWFKAYNFHIYDKTLYDAVKADYPANLVQDMPADTAAE